MALLYEQPKVQDLNNYSKELQPTTAGLVTLLHKKERTSPVDIKEGQSAMYLVSINSMTERESCIDLTSCSSTS